MVRPIGVEYTSAQFKEDLKMAETTLDLVAVHCARDMEKGCR
jgi:hypothetical protein